jgi:uncharacterized membrane protein YdcZ (DUF606 family)
VSFGVGFVVLVLLSIARGGTGPLSRVTTAAALFIDTTGWFGLTGQALTPQRVAAAGLVTAGLVLSRP